MLTPTALATYFSDAEIDDMCAGLKQSAAKIRHLRSLGYHVERKPNGRPLVRRSQQPAQPTGPAVSPKWSKAA